MFCPFVAEIIASSNISVSDKLLIEIFSGSFVYDTENGIGCFLSLPFPDRRKNIKFD